jgi:hypothetical protein
MSVEEMVEADTSTPDDVLVSDDEQSAVESSEEKESLFSPLAEQENQVEQPEVQDSYEVVVDGERLNVSLDELRNGYQRQADYTRGKQELAELRAEADQALTLMKALQDKPMETVQKLWEAVRRGDAPLPEPSAQSRDLPKTTANEDIDAIVQRKLEEALSSDPRIKAIEEEKQYEQVMATFNDIEKDYEVELSEADMEFVLNKAVEWGISDLEAVFAKLWHQREKIGKARENVAANSSSSGYGGQHQIPTNKPERFGTWRDAMNATLAEEGMGKADLERAISNL